MSTLNLQTVFFRPDQKGTTTYLATTYNNSESITEFHLGVGYSKTPDFVHSVILDNSGNVRLPQHLTCTNEIKTPGVSGYATVDKEGNNIINHYTNCVEWSNGILEGTVESPVAGCLYRMLLDETITQAEIDKIAPN